MMMNELEHLIYSKIIPEAYANEEIIFLYPQDDREIATIQVDGEELAETVLYLLDKYLPIGIIFNNYKIDDETYQIPVKYLV